MKKYSKGISERILKGLRENSAENETIANFLIEIAQEEISYVGGLRGEDYRKKIEEYLKKWSTDNED